METLTWSVGHGPDVGGVTLDVGLGVGVGVEALLDVVQHGLHDLPVVVITQVQGLQDVLHLHTQDKTQSLEND